MRALHEFIEFDDFYRLYQPLTPGGRSVREARELFTEADALAAAHDRVEACLAFLAAEPEAIPGMEHALARIPRLPDPLPELMDPTEIFLVKKFLFNAQRCRGALSDELRALFGFPDVPAELWQALCVGQSTEETFSLSDAYAEPLADIRRRVRALDLELRDRRHAFLDDLRNATGIDFQHRDFVLVRSEELCRHVSIVVEPFDALQYVVRPAWNEDLLELQREREALVSSEREVEVEVCRTLSAQIRAARRTLADLTAALTSLDVSLAKARLAQRHGMVRPRFGNRIAIRKGRLLPLAEQCEKNGMTYWPLDWNLPTRIAVVCGSNMGGKTVALRTLGFLQTLAQMGFFVPAERFESRIFADIIHVGQKLSEGMEGLSSFGMEIHDFVTSWEKARQPTLYLVDEFARTTNSIEASALISAVLRAFAERTGVTAVLSTHFLAVDVSHGAIAVFRMLGLDRAAFSACYQDGFQGNLAERIRRINRFMRYELEPLERMEPSFDALSVAEMLGLDPAIVTAARTFAFGKGSEQ